MQRLLGILVFVGRVLLSGMWYLSRSVMALRVAARNGYVRMSEEWNEELQWWVELLNHWNCKAVIRKKKRIRSRTGVGAIRSRTGASFCDLHCKKSVL